MSTIDDHYLISCPFCTNANAFPPSPSSPIPQDPDRTKTDPPCFPILSTPHVIAFLDILPMAPGHILLCPRRHFPKLSDLYSPAQTSPDGGAAGGNAEQAPEAARQIGQWLPLLSRAMCKVTGVEDWNIVQNNGVLAAQVVGHVHFHLIPRYQEGRTSQMGAKGVLGQGPAEMGMLKSWRMFGRGARQDLDEDEGEEIAAKLRQALRDEIGNARQADKSKI